MSCHVSSAYPAAAAEYGVIRTYLEWIVSLPWNKSTEDNLDLRHARKVLDQDHYDIEKVKDRIIEQLAVRKLKPDTRGPILCFVGPPGVGKTSLGKSIARALGRKFERISVGVCATRRRSGATGAPTSGRCPARSSGPAGRREQQPRLHDRRDRQDGCRLPRRSLQRHARGARPRAEPELPRPLPRPAVRSVEGHVHHDGECARDDPGSAARPHGDHPALRIHRRGEAPDRAALSRAAPDRAQRPAPRADRDQGPGHRDRDPRVHARGGCSQPGTRDRHDLPQGGARLR